MNSRLPPSREIPILPQIIHRIHPSKIENAGRSHLTESPGLRDRRRAASTSGDRAAPRRAASNPAPGRVSSAASTPPRESRRRGGDADAFVSRPPRRFQIWGGCFEIKPYGRLTCWVGGCSLESDGEGEAVGDGRREMVTGGSGRIWAVRAADSRAASAIFECQRVGYRLGRVGWARGNWQASI